MSEGQAKLRKSIKVMLDTPVIISWTRLFDAEAGPLNEDGTPGQPKFSCTFILPEGYPEAKVREIKEAVMEVGSAKFGKKAFIEGIQSGTMRRGFRTDFEGKGYPAGSVGFLNARTSNPPGVVSRVIGPDGRPTPITKAEGKLVGGPNEVYSGCFVLASIQLYGFQKGGGKGVAVGLGNVQLWDSGTRLDNRKAAQDEFEADMTATPASIGDMTGEGEEQTPAVDGGDDVNSLL